jgi:hypothetical protein
VRLTGATRGRSAEECSLAPGGASGAIVRLDGCGEPGPRRRNLLTEGLASRKVRSEPAFGAQQLKSGPPAADCAEPVVHGLLVGLVELVLVPGARGVQANPFDRERGIATGPPGNANTDHAAGRNSNHTETRAGTPVRESSVVAPVVRAPIIHVARRGLNHEGDTHRSGPVESVAPFGHRPGNQWDALSPVSGSGHGSAPGADGLAREPVSVKDLVCRALGVCAVGLVSVQGGVYGQSLAPGLCPRRPEAVNSDLCPITAGLRTHDPMVLKRRDDSRSVAYRCLETYGHSKRRKLFPGLSTRLNRLPLRVPAQASVSDQPIPSERSWTP